MVLSIPQKMDQEKKPEANAKPEPTKMHDVARGKVRKRMAFIQCFNFIGEI